MSCAETRSRLSPYLDDALGGEEARGVRSHLETCADCGAHWRELRESLTWLAELPRLEAPERLADRVFDRLELESRGPGLALLFRPSWPWQTRPLMFQSLVPALALVGSVVWGAVALDRPLRLPPATDIELRSSDSGTEGNPLTVADAVRAPRLQRSASSALRLSRMGEGSLFVETVVARDGSVADVTMLDGDSSELRPLLDALWSERFAPGRYRGRAVAVSVYRLISRVEVRAPAT